MLRYYRQRLNNFFSRLSRENVIPELETDVVGEETRVHITPTLTVDKGLQPYLLL